MANIVGHYNRLSSKNETNSVWDAYRERGMSEEKIEELKKRVEETAGKPVDSEHRSMGLQFTRSFDNFEYEYMDYILVVHEQWERGNMPFEGALSEQPNKIVEIMNLLSGLKSERQYKLNKERQKNLERSKK